MKTILLAYRVLRVVIHLFAGMATCALLFPWLDKHARNGRIQRWSRRLLGICGVRLAPVAGAAALPNALVVANHVSWLDIFVINALYPCRFVAKAEIRAWPLLGWLVDKAGTVFIARGSRRDLRHIFQDLVDKLAAGERVAFFPEGTTAAQGQLLPFHANLFEAAVDARKPVQPFALSYADAAGQPHPSIEFIGDMSFAASMLVILGGSPITARLTCTAPIDGAGAHRRALAQASREAVAGALGLAVRPE